MIKLALSLLGLAVLGVLAIALLPYLFPIIFFAAIGAVVLAIIKGMMG